MGVQISTYGNSFAVQDSVVHFAELPLPAA